MQVERSQILRVCNHPYTELESGSGTSLSSRWTNISSDSRLSYKSSVPPEPGHEYSSLLPSFDAAENPTQRGRLYTYDLA